MSAERACMSLDAIHGFTVTYLLMRPVPLRQESRY